MRITLNAATETGGRHEPRRAGVRAVAAGDHQRSRLHPVRLQFFQAEDDARLADVWNVLGVDPLSHDFGHLWYSLLGFKGNPHLNPIHILSNVAIVAGFILLSSAWRVLFQAQRDGTLATTGPYAYVRHPQYVAFIVIMFGFLLHLRDERNARCVRYSARRGTTMPPARPPSFRDGGATAAPSDTSRAHMRKAR